ncbi:citryl-CoA lyase [Treponema sp.]
MTDAILVGCADHGVEAPSTHVARSSASCGVPLAAAVAAGIASVGTNHGGAGEACARLLQRGVLSGETNRMRIADSLLDECLAGGKNLPGYGHRIYKDADPRATFLLGLAEDLALSGAHSALAQTLETQLELRKGKRLVLNVDGAQAAILSDLGVAWNRVQSFFIIGRTLGLCTQVLEELESGQALAYIKASQPKAEYAGPDQREWRAT